MMGRSDLEVRPAGLDDLERCGQIAVALRYPAWSAPALEERLGRSGTLLLVAVLASRGRRKLETVGFALFQQCGPEAELHLVGVVPEARRHGVGKALVDAGHHALGAAEVEAVYLEVAADNTPARRLYERLGYAEVGRRPRYYPSGADAIVLRCRLPS